MAATEHHSNVRNRRLLTGIVGGLVGRGVALIAPFFVMPAMLNYLGETDFGVWMTAVAITSMAAFMDFGIGNGLLTRLSSAHGRGDHSLLRSYTASAYAFLLVITGPLLAVLLMLSWAWPEAIAAVVGSPPGSGAVQVIVATLACFLLGIPAAIIQRVMSAAQLVWLSSAWGILASVLSVVLCLLSISVGLTKWLVVAAYAMPPVAVALISTVVYFSKNPEVRPTIADVSHENVRDLAAIGVRFLIISGIGAVALNVDNFIIAQRFGPGAVTDYAVPAKLATLMSLVVTTMFLPLWSANGEALARGDFAWVKRMTRAASAFGALIVAVVSFSLYLASDWLLLIWMGRAFAGQSEVVAWLCGVSVLMAAVSPFNMVLNCIGGLRVQLYAWSALLLLALPLKWLLVKPDSLHTLAAVTAVTYALTVGVSVVYAVWRSDFGRDGARLL